MAEAYEWDEAKNQRNIAKHGIDFADAFHIVEGPMLVRRDDRRDYKETRWIALGELNGIVVVLVYTRRKRRVRIISIRRANRSERQVYQERIHRSS